MLKNQLKIAFRNLVRNRVHTGINILGLGIGIAAIVWAFQNYRFATSWDNFHHHREALYRGLIIKEGVPDLQGVFPSPAGPILVNEFEGVSEMARLMYRQATLRSESGMPLTGEVLFTDAAFTDMFTFPARQGEPKLSEPSLVVLSKSAAMKYFGTDDPVGKTLNLYTGTDYEVSLRVTAVLEDPPSNSTIRFEVITNLENYRFEDGTGLESDDWKTFAHAIFFRIPDPTDLNLLEKGLNSYREVQHKARADWKVDHFVLKKMPDHARLSLIDNNALRSCPEDSAILGPLILAILLLLAACLNFANTTIAGSSQRLREIGVRKVLGSSKTSLQRNFLVECSLIVFVAILVSVIFNQWWLPRYSEMFFFVDLKADYFHDGVLLAFLAFLWIFVTFFAGVYPAFYLSRFSAGKIFKGTVQYGGTNLFSRLLLGLQVSISLITVISGIAFTANARFQRDYDYGYDKNNVIVLPVNRPIVSEALHSFQNQEGVVSIAGAYDHIGYSFRQKTTDVEGRKFESNFLAVGEDYLDCMQIKLLSGRNFYRDSRADAGNSTLVTRNFALAQGWTPDQGLNKQIRIDTTNYTIIGVVENFHQSTLFNEVEPAMFVLAEKSEIQQLVIRAAPGIVTELFVVLKDKWQQLFPYQPFAGFYQNEIEVESYQITMNIASIFLWFSLVSLLLSSAGLYGLLSLTFLKKMRELAIRKVVGARFEQLAVVLGKGYFWIILGAIFVGLLCGYMFTVILLDLIFRINIGVPAEVMVISTVTVILITLITGFFKLKFALDMQPAEVLKGD